MLIKGKISFESNVLFLKKENVELLDGTVEEISKVEHLVDLLQSEL